MHNNSMAFRSSEPNDSPGAFRNSELPNFPEESRFVFHLDYAFNWWKSPHPHHIRHRAVALPRLTGYSFFVGPLGGGWRLDPQLFRCKSIDQLISNADQPEHRLKKTLGWLSLTALGIGAIIGSGIFVLTGTAAAGETDRFPSI